MSFVLAVMLAAWPDSLASTRAQAPASGPLRVHAINKRYFADASGKVVYLTGSHNWDTFQR
ncbi:MAG: hypothetical protein ACREB3_13660, partial [Burkholderiales bacterium]